MRSGLPTHATACRLTRRFARQGDAPISRKEMCWAAVLTVARSSTGPRTPASSRWTESTSISRSFSAVRAVWCFEGDLGRGGSPFALQVDCGFRGDDGGARRTTGWPLRLRAQAGSWFARSVCVRRRSRRPSRLRSRARTARREFDLTVWLTTHREQPWCGRGSSARVVCPGPLWLQKSSRDVGSREATAVAAAVRGTGT